MKQKIFLTDGMVYIASHTCNEFLNNSFEVVIYNNLSNSDKLVLDRIEDITGENVIFIEGDIRDEKKLSSSLIGCNSVIQFAGLKAVGEFSKIPIDYYDKNISETLCLLLVMQKNKNFNLLFSSSATVYCDPQYLPLDKKHSLSSTNSYGKTKLYIEEILRDVYSSNNNWQFKNPKGYE